MTSSRNSRSSRWKSDDLLLTGLRFAAAVTGAVLLLICGFLVWESIPAVREIGLSRFFGDPSWHPAADASAGTFNLLPMVAGTLAVACGAVVLAAPVGIASAIFGRFYAPVWLSGGYRRIVELLAGIPSVVYGFWGLVTLVPLIARWHPPGPSLLAGVLVLGLMIMPTVALAADSALANVPVAHLHGAAALGLSRWTTVRSVALPAARPALTTGILLQTGRALGETMAVLMVCGNVVQMPGGPFEPVRTLTANIALEMSYAMGSHRGAMFVSGLLLMLLVLLLVIAAEFLARIRRAGSVSDRSVTRDGEPRGVSPRIHPVEENRTR